MTEDFDEPMRELVLTQSAWMKLKAMANELLKDDNALLGFLLIMMMGNALGEANKELKQNEKNIEEMRRGKE